MLLPACVRLRLTMATFLALIAACQRMQSPSQRPTPLAQDPFVEVYFNHELSAEYTEPYRKQTRVGDNLEQQIVSAIAVAQSHVDVAVQELRLPKIAQALVERHKAGVKVRVILENSYSRPWSEFTKAELGKLPPRERDRYNEFRQLVDRNKDGQLSPDEINQGDALVILRHAKVSWIDDTADGSAGSSLMHHKFVAIDGRYVVVTSGNFTTSDIHGDFTNPHSTGNANNLLKIDSPELAALFTEEFNLMWGDGPGGKPNSKFGVKKPFRRAQQVQLGDSTITVQFSPTSSTQLWRQSTNGLIGETLNSAIHSIDLALFVFSDQRLANILETDHQKGVQVRALIDPGFAYRPYSEALDLMGVSLSNNCKYEVDNHPWQNPISTVGVPQLLKGDLLHHKFGVVDGQTVITGSHNWSEAANNGNDETLLVINSATVAAHYRREFERLYANAYLGVPDRLQKKIQVAQKQCLEAAGSREQGVGSREQEAGTKEQGVGSREQRSKVVGAGFTDRLGSKQRSGLNPPSWELSSQTVNLNRASLKELEALPGVGPKLAQRIIQARQHKPFTSLEDLERVPGVGSKLMEKLSDRVSW